MSFVITLHFYSHKTLKEAGYRILRILDQINFWINKVCTYIIGFLLTVITVVLFIQVVARYVFSTGTFWSDELARYSMVWLVLVGAAVAVREKSLMNVDVLESLFPKSRVILNIFQSITILVYSAFILYIGFGTLELVSAQRSPNMGLSMSFVYAALPVAAVLLILHAIVNLFYRKDRREEVKE